MVVQTIANLLAIFKQLDNTFGINFTFIMEIFFPPLLSPLTFRLLNKYPRNKSSDMNQFKNVKCNTTSPAIKKGCQCF